MTWPSPSQAPLPGLLAAFTASSDRPIWRSATHRIAFVPFQNAADMSALTTGTAYNINTTGKYAVAPFLSTNGEPSTTTGSAPYTRLDANSTTGGFTVLGVDVQASSGKLVWTATDLTMGPGVTLVWPTGLQSFYGGLLVECQSTSAWILDIINFGVETPLVDPNWNVIHWPSSPLTGTIFDLRP